MSAFGKYLRECQGGVFLFWCKGCRLHHGVWTTEPNPITKATWGFNRNPDAPTFTPSIVVQFDRLTDKGWDQQRLWRDAGMPEPAPKFDSIPVVCHSFVTDGRIQYLSDCTHELANQTIELPNIDLELDNA